jgi:hypothetical protein
MYQSLLSTHSHMRWLILVTALLAILMPFLNSAGPVGKKNKLPALLFMIACDIQLLLGLLLYFVYSPFGMKAYERGMSYVMKDPLVRKIAVEHFILMLLALVIVHIGYTKVKKALDNEQMKKVSTKFFLVALIVILAGLPWARII